MKRIYKLLAIFVFFFLFTGVVYAAHGSGGGSSQEGIYSGKSISLSEDDTLETCVSKGHSKYECVYACVGGVTKVTPGDAIVDSLTKIMTQNLEIKSTTIEEVRVGTHVIPITARSVDMTKLKNDLRTYANTLPNGYETLFVSYYVSNSGSTNNLTPQSTTNHTVVSGNNQNYIQNGEDSNDLVISCYGDSNSVSAIYVKNSSLAYNQVSQQNGQWDVNYSISGDTTVTSVTLTKKFLDGQTDGQKIIRIAFSDGGYAEARIIIKEWRTVSNTFTVNGSSSSSSTGSNAGPKCYTYFHDEKVGTPPYNTTVWAYKKPDCGFTETNWTKSQCSDGRLDHAKTFTFTSGRKIKITYSGYGGTADFYDMTTGESVPEMSCDNLKGLHIIYRIITIAAPILTIMFVTFDFVRSIISGDPKRINDFKNKLIRRIIALIVLILLPLIVYTLVTTLSNNGKIATGSWIKCIVKGYSENNSSVSSSTSSQSTTINVTSNSSKSKKNKSSNNNTGTGSGSVTQNSDTSDDNKQKDMLAAQKAQNSNSTTNPKSSSNDSSKTTAYTEILKKDKIEYNVIKVDYSGGIGAWVKKIKSNGISQTYGYNSHGKSWGNVCWFMSRIQACGIRKSKLLTLSNTGLDSLKTKTQMEAYEKTHSDFICSLESKFVSEDEAEFADYVMDKIDQGQPVVIRVLSGYNSSKKLYKQHYLTVIGYKSGSKRKSTKDFLILDSWDTQIERMDQSGSRKAARCNQLLEEKRTNCTGSQFYARPIQ